MKLILIHFNLILSISVSRMNMRLPAYLQDEIHRDDQQIPMINVDLFVDFSEYEWMAEEELEDFDRQVI